MLDLAVTHPIGFGDDFNRLIVATLAGQGRACRRWQHPPRGQRQQRCGVTRSSRGDGSIDSGSPRRDESGSLRSRTVPEGNVIIDLGTGVLLERGSRSSPSPEKSDLSRRRPLLLATGRRVSEEERAKCGLEGSFQRRLTRWRRYVLW